MNKKLPLLVAIFYYKYIIYFIESITQFPLDDVTVKVILSFDFVELSSSTIDVVLAK